MSKERAHDGDDAFDIAGATSAGTSESDGTEPPAEPKRSVATKLVELATDQYELGCTPDAEPYAIPKSGSPIVRQLRGGRGSLRAELARAFYEDTGAAPAQSALADALMVIDGMAQLVDPVELHLRVAEHDGALLLDLGDQTGRCVMITSTGWEVVDAPPPCGSGGLR